MVYIICTKKLTTGGAELLHQLCYELNSVNIDSNMSYYSRQDNIYTEVQINHCYKKYCKYDTSSKINDEIGNVVIFPETMAYLARYIKHAKVIIWWLSIDNYLINFSFDYYRCNGLKATFSELKKLFRRPSFKYLKRFKHIVQSQYAKDFLNSRGINTQIVSDYVNLDFLNSNLEIRKENIVCYNPKKGLEVSKKVIEYLSKKERDLIFVPIIGLNSEGVIALMKRSKIYMDFGGHPGKDRMPREARIQDCVIVTGRRGSSNNEDDIHIDGIYKFFENKRSFLEDLDYLFCDIIENYEFHLNRQIEYKNRIVDERNQFKIQVNNFVNNIINA